MKPDRVLQYCVHNDYPIFRKHIKDYRDKVNKIILYPSRHHGYIDFEYFAKKNIKETWVEPVEIDYGKEDWRQAETTPCLEHSTSEWLWFSEQDFFVSSWEKFFNIIEELSKHCDMFGWWQESSFKGGYVHPCCLFIKREWFEKTKKDFCAHPEIIGCDHFAMITRDMEELGGKICKLQDNGFENWVDAFHLQGLTYPYQNWPDKTFGVGNQFAFYTYNYWSRSANVKQHKKYVELSLKIQNYMEEIGLHGSDNNPENQWKKFFV